MIHQLPIKSNYDLHRMLMLFLLCLYELVLVGIRRREISPKQFRACPLWNVFQANLYFDWMVSTNMNHPKKDSCKIISVILPCLSHHVIILTFTHENNSS